MLFRISVVASLAALVVASPVAEAAGPLVVERSTTPGSFPANLARRFQSTVGLLRSRSAVKAAAVEEKRSVSDELVHMIKDLNRRANASPSASSALPPQQTAPAPGPSASASQAASRASYKRDLEYVKQKIAETPWDMLDSSLLCPAGEQACPIFPRMGTFECVQTDNALESCGGCVSKGQGEDCTAIKGALGVGCASGQCQVFSCSPGYELVQGTANNRARCRKLRK